MAVRALIIAIQSYPDAEGMARSLPGTLQAGLDFRAWLLHKLKQDGLDQDAQILFCSEPPDPSGLGAKRADILHALKQLKQAGRGATEELFFFFSGHGFAFVEKPGSRADVIITSDYRDDTSGDCCLNLDQIVGWLRDHLGPGNHYYFIDACRNKLDGNQVQVGSLLPPDRNTLAEASSFVLQSTVEGAVAAVGDAFPKTLLDGLRGRGRAKVWDPNVAGAMLVRYDSLRSFLKDSLAKKQPITSKVSGELGESDVVFARIQPVPDVVCSFEIEGRLATDQVTVTIRRGRAAAEPPRALSGQTINLQPDNYVVSLAIEGATIEPAEMPVDLYEDMTLKFRKLPTGTRFLGGELESFGHDDDSWRLSDESLGLRSVDLQRGETPAAMVDLKTGFVHLNDKSETLRLLQRGTDRLFRHHSVSDPIAQFCAIVGPSTSAASAPLARAAIDKLRRGEIPAPEELAALEVVQRSIENSAAPHPRQSEVFLSIPRMAIAYRLPEKNQGLDFSESLSGITDTDLNLWLAILGGGRILGPRGDFSKIAKFPLHNFSSESAGASPVYVLAGLEDPSTQLQVNMADGPSSDWHEATTPVGMPGIREAYCHVGPGPKLISFRLDGGPALTVVSQAIPNHGTLVTVTLDDEGEFRVSQFSLPLGDLRDELPPHPGEHRSDRNRLEDLRVLALANRAFAEHRNVSKVLGWNSAPSVELAKQLSSNWCNPFGAALAGYELLRRGDADGLSQVATHMTRFLPAFPDTATLAKLAGKDVNRPASPPLFLDGLRAFPGEESWLPLPSSHLDFNGSWTAWRAAVR